MNTRVVATARLNPACRHELREKLKLDVDPVSELSRLNSVLGSRQLTLPELRQLVSAPIADSVLSTLAAGDFSRVRARLEGGSRSALETTAADLQAELAETLATATAVVAATIRGMTAETLTKSGLELGYNATTQHCGSTTCVELRRGDEVVLVGVHDGGSLEFEHGGLTDDLSGEHQLHLERAVERCGVFVAQHS